jgi:SSS family solute:Na+ symporter
MADLFKGFLLSGGLISLNWADLLIIIIYFLIVLGIGYYLVRFTKT